MEPNAQFRSAVRGFYLWIGSMVVAGAAPLVAIQLVDRGTTLARVAAVVLGVGGMLPWMWVVFSIIRRGDEFVRRLHLIAFGFAFGGALVLLVTLGWLVRADFIDPPDLMLVWLGCLVVWFIAIMGAKRYFERAG
jgi:hypothetical protein